MIKLRPLKTTEKEQHYQTLKSRFDEKLPSSTTGLKEKDYESKLIEKITKSIRTILIGDPLEIADFARSVITDFPEFTSYLALRRKPDDKNHVKHKNTLKIINECFNYDWFSNQVEWGAYALVQAYNLRTCPYCQANHVNLHIEKKRQRKSLPTFRLRPPLDHYLPKALYPYLSVSISNLIPCCTQCNSGVKTSGDTLNKEIPHPLDSTRVSVNFSIRGTIRNSIHGAIKASDILLSLTGVDQTSNNHLEAFQLQDRYRWYRHEIKDLIDRHDEHKELDENIRSVVCREKFVLGFFERNAEERSLGLCLRDIYRELDC